MLQKLEDAILQKRFYILFVARGEDGQLRKISIPVHYLYVFVIGAAIGFLSLTGIASSYTRMLLKVSQFNQLRTENDQLNDAQVSSSLDQLHALRSSALSGATMVGLTMGLTRNATTADWVRANAAPNLWPVQGQVT